MEINWLKLPVFKQYLVHGKNYLILFENNQYLLCGYNIEGWFSPIPICDRIFRLNEVKYALCVDELLPQPPEKQ